MNMYVYIYIYIYIDRYVNKDFNQRNWQLTQVFFKSGEYSGRYRSQGSTFCRRSRAARPLWGSLPRKR